MTLGWKSLGPTLLTGVDWSKLLKETDPSIDPYLVWADMTDYEGLGGPPDRLPIAVEVNLPDLPVPNPDAETRQPGSAIPRGHEVSPEFGFLDIPGAYKTLLDGAQDPVAMLATRFFTASVARSSLKELLRHAHHIKRFQLGIPRIPAVGGSAHSLTSGAGRGLARVVIGVIDDGFAFAHPQFLDVRGRPRTVYLWDQDPSRTPGPFSTAAAVPLPAPAGPRAKIRFREAAGFSYGGELRWNDLCQAVLAGRELDAYRSVDYVPHQPNPDVHATSLTAHPWGLPVPAGTMLTRSHGTSVLDLCAGNVPVLTPQRQDAPTGTLAPAAPAQVDSDMATRPLVLVQLPTRTTLDTTGGSLAVHLLDGIRYILRRAESIPPPPDPDSNDIGLEDAPDPDPTLDGRQKQYYPNNLVVINISYGALAGGHDGTSIVEEAIRELTQGPRRRPRTWVVVAAGNGHESRTHARLELAAGGDSKSLTWRIGPDNLLESYLEVWIPSRDRDGNPPPIPGSDDAGVLDEVLAALQITLHPPGGLPAVKVQHGEALALRSRSKGPVVAGAVFPRRVPQSRMGTMLLLAVASSRRIREMESKLCQSSFIPHGDWRIEISLSAQGAVRGRKFVLHAWAERNDQLWGNVRPQQTSVLGDDPVPTPTEFSATTLLAAVHGLRAHGDEAPRPFQPDMSLSSVATLVQVPDLKAVLPGPKEAFMPPQGSGKVPGGALVVGGLRLADQEVPHYSASGPARGTIADQGRMPGGRPGSDGIALQADERNGPDISAPSDLGTAARGLPTVGTLSGLQARLSGTSAAAPLVTRQIAAGAAAFARSEFNLSPPPNAALRTLNPANGDSRPAVEAARRTTPTPTRDDRFRLGREILVPPSK